MSQKLKVAIDQSDKSLHALTQARGLPYHTVRKQLTEGRDLPFSYVDSLAAELGQPISDFSDQSGQTDNHLDAASKVRAVTKELGLLTPDEGRPTIAEFWKRLQEVQFRADEIGEMSAYCDIYDRLGPETEIPVLESVGRLSHLVTYLKIGSQQQYFERVSQMDIGLRQRSKLRHVRCEFEPFQVSTEIIKEIVDGTLVSGCYLVATARTTDREGREKTSLLTEFVTRFPAPKEA